MERASGLQEKLGPILFQLPPTWPLNGERLQAFLTLLSDYPQQRFAFEFRHASWLTSQVYRGLEAAGAALCLPVSPEVPMDLRLTAPWTYMRMHRGQWGMGYSDTELAEWGDRIQSFLAQGIDVYVYFNNDAEGHALKDACRLQTYLMGNPQRSKK
jgi:uncharacterized protein YecE (DUF72 family)